MFVLLQASFSFLGELRIHVLIPHVLLLAQLPNMETVYRKRNSWAAPWSRSWTSALTAPSQQLSAMYGMSLQWSRRGRTSGQKMMTCCSPMLLWLVAVFSICFALWWVCTQFLVSWSSLHVFGHNTGIRTSFHYACRACSLQSSHVFYHTR